MSSRIVIDAALQRFDRQLSQRGMNELEIANREQRHAAGVDMSQLRKGNGDTIHEACIVSTLQQCQTENALYLCINGLQTKLQGGSQFVIGGTCNENSIPDLWFLGTASPCHGGNNLLKLFVMSRTGDKFSLVLPSQSLSDPLEINESQKYSKMMGPMKEFMFENPNVDEIMFVKTYSFSHDDMEKLDDYFLLMPCYIEIHSKVRIHPDIITKVRHQYMLKGNEGLYHRRQEGTFSLESASHKQYPLHSFVAAARSSILLEAIINNHNSYFLDFNDDDVETIIEFMYTNSVRNVTAEKAHKLLQLGDIMKFNGMKHLGASALSAQLNENNAMELAILARRYNLQDLQVKAFHFIKQHPEILYSKAVNSLNDVDLMRSMLKFVANPCACEN